MNISVRPVFPVLFLCLFTVFSGELAAQQRAGAVSAEESKRAVNAIIDGKRDPINDQSWNPFRNKNAAIQLYEQQKKFVKNNPAYAKHRTGAVSAEENERAVRNVLRGVNPAAEAWNPFQSRQNRNPQLARQRMVEHRKKYAGSSSGMIGAVTVEEHNRAVDAILSGAPTAIENQSWNPFRRNQYSRRDYDRDEKKSRRRSYRSRRSSCSSRRSSCSSRRSSCSSRRSSSCTVRRSSCCGR